MVTFDELKKMVSEYPAERAAEVTGIDKTVIESLARDFAKAKNAAIHASLGINLGTFGTLGYWLVHCLNTITGRLDKKKSMIFCMSFLNTSMNSLIIAVSRSFCAGCKS